MVEMGFRAIKTAIGAGLALWIANYMDVEYATFTAIIVIMCIERTKKKTLMTMRDKFFASVLSLMLGALIFELLGYHPFVLGLFIFIFMPIVIRLRIQVGFVTSMVVLTHVYMVGNVSLQMFLNEFYLIFIGMGIALLVNSIMPDLQNDIATYKSRIEKKFQSILFEFSNALRNSCHGWDGQEILAVEDLIAKAKNVAIQDVENHLLRKHNQDYYYLEMREDQLALLKQMMKMIAVFSFSNQHVQQKEMLADFLAELSENIHSGDTTSYFLKELDALHESFRQTPLPMTRAEFEIRANLFYLLFEIDNYLTIKQKYFSKKKIVY